MPNDYDRMNIRQTSVLGKPGAGMDRLMGSMTGQNAPEPQTVEVEKIVEVVDDTRIGPFRKTKIGLIQEAPCTQEEWLKAGEQLFQFEDYLQLFIGDWLVSGEREWGTTYEAMAAHFHRNVETLYNYRWVCSSVEISLRRENLFYSHYKEVAALTPDQQAEWLNWASKNNISVGKLRRAMLGKPIPKSVTPERQAAKYTSLINKAVPNLQALDDKRRQQIAESAEWLAAYYVDIARRARSETGVNHDGSQQNLR